MKKIIKILILSILIISVLIGITFVYWLKSAQNIRKEVLNYLNENLEFCEILKDNISFRKGEFWLICNGRPFYTTYENGEVKTEMNGWSFFKKDQNLWKELENCDFYDFKDSELIFYCPKDFNSTSLTAKIYRFDTNSLKMEKIEEKNFLEVIADDIKSIYSFLSGCEIEKFSLTKSGDYPAVLWLTFKCDDGNYVVGTDLATVPLQPPILADDKLSYEKRARTSFEKAFGLPIERIETMGNQVIIDSNNFEVKYTYSETVSTINYNIKEVYNENDAQMRIKEFGKYFIFPPLKGIEKVESLGEPYENIIAYKINDKNIISINWMKPVDAINAFWRKTEGIYR